MKRQNLKFAEKAQQTFKGVCILVLSLCLNNSSLSQSEPAKVGISVTSSISGAGFGTMYTPGVFYQKNNCKIELGMNVQKRKLNISGIQSNFEYTLFDDSKDCYGRSLNGGLELFVFLTNKYSSGAYLSTSQIKRERMIGKDGNIPYENLKYTAIEGYVGVGLKIKLSNKLKFNNAIGFGGWKTLKGENGLYRDYNGVSISLTTGLSYDF